MGIDAFHLHVKGVTQEAVVDAYRTRLPNHAAIVTRNVNGWVTVCDAGQNPDTGSTICKACRAPGVVLELVRSDLLCYHVFDAEGVLRTKCDFSADYGIRAIPEEGRTGLAGNLEAFGAVFDCDPQAVRTILEMRHSFRDDNLWALCELLGIRTAGCAYYDFVRGDVERDLEVLGDWAGYIDLDPDAIDE